MNTSLTDFKVFKQSDGRYRWIAASSNAYRDRDNEIVSTKALEQAVVIGDKTGYRGPLRWWHMPGVDLGDCDFQAMHGRFLVESGTFRGEQVGAAIATKALDLQLSIGFTHPSSEPDQDGVFNNIAIFERSLVPAGRAANPFTQLVVKGNTMDQVKIEALKSLGIDETFLAGLLGQVEHKDASVQASGVAFKSDDAPTTDTPLWTADEAQELAKAIAPHLTQALTDAIVAQQQVATEQTVKAFKEFAELVAGAIRQKDDALAAARQQTEAQATQIAALDGRLKSLEGEQPRNFYRASQDPATAQGVAALKSLGEPQPDSNDPFAEVFAGLLGNAFQR